MGQEAGGEARERCHLRRRSHRWFGSGQLDHLSSVLNSISSLNIENRQTSLRMLAYEECMYA